MSAWRIVRRKKPLEIGSFAILAIAFSLSLLVSALLLYAQGKNGVMGIAILLQGGFGDLYCLEESLLKAIPVFLCSMGVALCFRLQIWNIGAEGQYVMGTVGGAWFAFQAPALHDFLCSFSMFESLFGALPWLYGFFALLGMLLAAMLAGGLWAAIPAFFRQRWAVNEIISTLMLNYIAIKILDYLIYGSWKDPAALGFPRSVEFADYLIIEPLFGQIHWGILICVAVGAFVSFLLKYTRLGFELKAAGSNARAARYAGINYNALVMFVMVACGALAGLAGIQESSSAVQHIDPQVSLGYGFTAVVVAWLARLRTMRIVFFAFLLAGLRVGVSNLQIDMQVSSHFASTIEGIILLTVLAGQFFDEYVIQRKGAALVTAGEDNHA